MRAEEDDLPMGQFTLRDPGEMCWEVPTGGPVDEEWGISWGSLKILAAIALWETLRRIACHGRKNVYREKFELSGVQTGTHPRRNPMRERWTEGSSGR